MTSLKNTTVRATLGRLSLATAIGALSIGLLSGISGSALAAPEPSPVATQWEFTFEEGPLRLAWVDDGDGMKPYFYLTYRVTNHWGA